MKKTVSIIAVLAVVLAALASCGQNNDDTTPAGMKLASSETASYLFYVPETWQSDVSSGAATAYYSNSDTSSVSVMTFSLGSSDASVSDWWDSFEGDFKMIYDDFEIISREAVKLDGVDGEKIVFVGTLKHDEEAITFKFMQVAAVRQKTLSAPEAYVFTYTSSPEVYDSHLADVQRMLDAFRFN